MRSSSLRSAGAVTGALICLLAGPRAWAEPATQVDKPAETITFGSGIPAPAPVRGERKKGAHATLMKLSAGFSSPLHTHEHHLWGVVVKGVLRHWLEGQDRERAPRLSAGSTWFTPGRLRHHTACLGPEDCQFLSLQDGAFDARVVPPTLVEAPWRALEEDPLAERLGQGWSWLRPVPSATRFTRAGLDLRVLPGNIVFDRTDGQNILLRPLPTSSGPVAVGVGVTIEPEAPFEQAGLALFADESSYVKLVVERYNGQTVVNLVREEQDKIAVIASSPPVTPPVQLRLTLVDDTVTGQMRSGPRDPWSHIGATVVTTPRPSRVALFAFMGVDKERWAHFERFQVLVPAAGQQEPSRPRGKP